MPDNSVHTAWLHTEQLSLRILNISPCLWALSCLKPKRASYSSSLVGLLRLLWSNIISRGNILPGFSDWTEALLMHHIQPFNLYRGDGCGVCYDGFSGASGPGITVCTVSWGLWNGNTIFRVLNVKYIQLKGFCGLLLNFYWYDMICVEVWMELLFAEMKKDKRRSQTECSVYYPWLRFLVKHSYDAVSAERLHGRETKSPMVRFHPRMQAVSSTLTPRLWPFFLGWNFMKAFSFRSTRE